MYLKFEVVILAARLLTVLNNRVVAGDGEDRCETAREAVFKSGAEALIVRSVVAACIDGGYGGLVSLQLMVRLDFC